VNLLVQLLRRDPVSQLSLDALGRLGDGVDLLLGADDRLGLDAGHVPRVGPGQEAVVVLGQGDQDALLDEIGLDLEEPRAKRSTAIISLFHTIEK
jgi:hypothetical protein